MIAVVHVITKLELGGAQENTLWTCAHLDRARFSVALIYGPGGHYDAQAAAMRDTALFPLPSLVREVSPASDARALHELRRLFTRLAREHAARGHDPAAFIVHTHSSKAGILGRTAARLARVPRVVHTIHGFGFHPGQSRATFLGFVAAERAASRLTDAFISVSRANLAEAMARGIVRPQHATRVIRSGFDLSVFRGLDRAHARAALGVDPAAELVVCIANLKPQKDPLCLVEAIRLLVQRRPRAVCWYAGDGELRPAVEQAIAAAGLGEHFRLLGWREDIPALLAAADVVTLSSRFEGLPRSAVQAVAAGRPFVGTRVDGTNEVIRDGRNGFLVEPGDPAALAGGLERALVLHPVDPEDAARIQEWDAARMVRAQEELYLSLLGLTPAPPAS